MQSCDNQLSIPSRIAPITSVAFGLRLLPSDHSLFREEKVDSDGATNGGRHAGELPDRVSSGFGA